ncbi:MAG TPA: DUF4328 domain-containing protein [Acidimicrobiales bacterium]
MPVPVPLQVPVPIPVRPGGLPRSPFQDFEVEHRSEPWAKWAVLVYVAVIVINGAIAWAVEGALQSFYHQVRYQLAHPGTHTSLVVNLPVWYRVVTGVGELLTVAGFILFLVWQHWAASTAGSLGYPARRSPALGVGGWFIPVCNLWFPYQAIRDCLPPGHPARRLVLHMWLWLIASLVVALVALGILWSAPTWATLAVGDVGAFATLVFGYFAFKSVGAIYDNHRLVLYPYETTDPVGVPAATAPPPVFDRSG